MKKNIGYKLYTVSVFAVLFMFSAGLIGGADKFENERLSALSGSPALIVDTLVSKSILFRAKLIDCFSYVSLHFFKTSSNDKVTVGSEGYLYFSETSDDYLGTAPLTEEELDAVADYLEKTGLAAKENGARFIFIVAPDKNSLYDHMPYNYVKGTGKSNAERLFEKLESDHPDVEYIDLFNVFSNEAGELYYRTDTHWNGDGAELVYKAVAEHLDIEDEVPQKAGEKGHTGDLYRMLYPDGSNNETAYIYDTDYEFVTPVRDFEAAHIETVNENGDGRLLMFRDSFANNLGDLFSQSFEYCVYDKSFPYDLTLIESSNADIVIAEIAERNLHMLYNGQ